jgi:hypothetical protein
MKWIACLLLGGALLGSGCLNVQHVEMAPPAEPVQPPPPPVMPGQASETNAPQVLQALNEELERATVENTMPPAPRAPMP